MPHDTDRQRAYDRARDSFDDLPPEDQAHFLLETTVSAVSRGAANASRALADELEDFFQGAGRSGKGRRQRSEEGDAERRDGPGPAEPPTGAQRAPGEAASERRGD